MKKSVVLVEAWAMLAGVFAQTTLSIVVMAGTDQIFPARLRSYAAALLHCGHIISMTIASTGRSKSRREVRLGGADQASGLPLFCRPSDAGGA